MGIGIPGVVYEGRALTVPNLVRWSEDVDLIGPLTYRLGVPVTLGNDANIGLLGAWAAGVARGGGEVLGLWIGTGVGAAPFMAALCFLTSLPRDEVVSLLRERAARLDHSLQEMQTTEERTILDPDKPSHPVEFVKLGAQQVRSEPNFTDSILGRIRAGSYSLSAEGKSPP